MNQIRQNETLKAARRCGLLRATGLHDALHGPVFIYDPPESKTLTQSDKEWIYSQVIDSEYRVKHLPYKCFRIVPSGNTYDFWMQVWWDGGETITIGLVPDDMPDCMLLVHRIHINEKGKLDGKILGMRRGEMATKDQLDELFKVGFEEWKGAVVDQPFTILSCLCLDMAHSTVVRVSPEPNRNVARSVEWTMARTHYLLLHRKHAERCAIGKRGPSALEMKRSAHWRRGHFRRLRSPRFTHKQGQQVPVKQAWIGPREWQGSDGKIYRVME